MTSVWITLVHEGSIYRQDHLLSKTTVTFAKLTLEQIEAYVASGESFGKAGAYGIQGLGCTLVERIDGCYYNVVGFPIQAFAQKLATMLDEEAN